MVRIDTEKPIERNLSPGVDLWEIVKPEEKRSKGGTLMLKIEFARVSKQTERLWDNVMLEGGGWGIGKEKLMAVLGGPFKGKLDALDLVNKRVWLSTGIEKFTSPDKKTGELVEREKLKVLISDPKASSSFAWCGIQHEKNIPAGHALPGEDTPF